MSAHAVGRHKHAQNTDVEGQMHRAQMPNHLIDGYCLEVRIQQAVPYGIKR